MITCGSRVASCSVTDIRTRSNEAFSTRFDWEKIITSFTDGNCLASSNPNHPVTLRHKTDLNQSFDLIQCNKNPLNR